MDDVLSRNELFVHRNRPEWGLAICTESRQNKTDFLFQDGTTRTFRDDFLHLMAPADKPRDVTTRVVNRLRKQANGRTSSTGGSTSTIVAIPLTDQIRILLHLFPGGFEDPDFIAKHRGAPEQRRRKGHHGLASADAQIQLARDAVGDALEAENVEHVVDIACGVLERTSLAPRALVKSLRERGLTSGFAEQLFSLLYNDEVSEFDRFTRWLMVLETALGAPAGWEIATAIPALVHPEHHIAVKRAPFQREAAWMAPNLALPQLPNAELYRRTQEMCSDLRDALLEAGRKPRDLLDVAAFIHIVMRPKHIELLATI